MVDTQINLRNRLIIGIGSINKKLRRLSWIIAKKLYFSHYVTDWRQTDKVNYQVASLLKEIWNFPAKEIIKKCRDILM